jgi:hypothetical protein
MSKFQSDLNVIRHSKARGPAKSTTSAKENFMAVFTRLGGTAAMARWAEENTGEFYKLYARLIPTEVDAAISGGLTLTDRDPTQRPEGYQRRGKAST